MSQDSQTIAVSGPTGLVGGALVSQLNERGDKVIGISRSARGGWGDTIQWHPDTGLANPARIEEVDTIVHLAGKNIAEGRWNKERKAEIRSSRVQGTRSLVDSIAAVEKRPKHFICASAIGYYGSRGNEELTEDSTPGDDFLAEVCAEWEQEAARASDLGMRVVHLRIGVVISPHGGALKKILTPFRFGLGGIVGNGKQYWSWVGLQDLVRMICFCIDNTDISGPVNAVGPLSTTNHDFTKILGAHLKRPTCLPMPGFAARIALGEMANALLLSSTRVIPRRLQDAGFEFQQNTFEECLQQELS